jgi:hypothetical protein
LPETARGIAHEYTHAGHFIITIKPYDYIPGETFNLDSSSHYLDTFYIHEEDTITWKNLIAIHNFGQLNWRSMEQSFMNAPKLCELPNTNIDLSNLQKDKFRLWSINKFLSNI